MQTQIHWVSLHLASIGASLYQYMIITRDSRFLPQTPNSLVLPNHFPCGYAYYDTPEAMPLQATDRFDYFSNCAH